MQASTTALAPADTPQPASARDLTIDFVRGLCLPLMMIDHVRNHWLTLFTYRPFGYFCAATVFVFLSGYVTGKVYSRYLSHANRFLIFTRLWRRAASIYLVHLAMSAATIVLTILSPEVATQLGREIELVVSKPWHAFLADALFMPSAPLLDVLPMYVFFILLAPCLLRLFQSGYGRYALSASGAIWMVAQAGYPLPLPPFVGIFDVASWQFLFVSALYLGFRQFTQPFERPKKTKSLNLALFGCMVALFMLRQADVFSLQTFSDAIPAWWIQKSTLGPLVLLNLFLWVSFMWLVPELLIRLTRQGRVFIAMGQHSLPVFAWHTSLFYLFLSLFPQMQRYSILGQAVIVCFAVVCLVFPVSLAVDYFVPARIESRPKGRQLPSFFLRASLTGLGAASAGTLNSTHSSSPGSRRLGSGIPSGM